MLLSTSTTTPPSAYSRPCLAGRITMARALSAAPSAAALLYSLIDSVQSPTSSRLAPCPRRSPKLRSALDRLAHGDGLRNIELTWSARAHGARAVRERSSTAHEVRERPSELTRSVNAHRGSRGPRGLIDLALLARAHRGRAASTSRAWGSRAWGSRAWGSRAWGSRAWGSRGPRALIDGSRGP